MKAITETIGKNRTGLTMSPVDAAKLVEVTEKAEPSSMGDELAIEQVRAAYELEEEPIGTMPPPASVKGAAKSAMKMLKGQNAAVLLDKLGERLAFERTGTRLYDALLAKRRAEADTDGAPAFPPLDVLERFRSEEAKHFQLVRDAIEQMGADPTAETPSADVSGVASRGIVDVLADPRTSVTQCLDAVLVAELADVDGWGMLIELMEKAGNNEIAAGFRTALVEEEEHLARVREWLSARLAAESGA